MKRSGNPVRYRLSAVVLALSLSSCQVLVLTYDGANKSPSTTAILTVDGSDGYDIVASDGAMRAAALEGNTAGNLRAAFWPADAVAVEQGQTCATWTSATSGSQQGAALQIRSVSGVIRAVTVTKNVFFGAQWIFNFHTWDSSLTTPFTQFGSVDLAAELNPGGQLAPYPWHFCARVASGQLWFKVWLDGEHEPVWSDSEHGGSATVPADYLQPGYAGWYIGHVAPGGSAEFTDLKAWKYVDEATTTTGPTSTTVPDETTTTTTGPTSTTVPDETTTTTTGPTSTTVPDETTTAVTTLPDTTTTAPPAPDSSGSVTVVNP